MHNNRRGFVVGGVAGLTALLAPSVAQACTCRRCRRTLVQPQCPAIAPLIAPSSAHCPAGFAWSNTPPVIPDASNMLVNTPHAFTLTGTGLYTCFVGGATFNCSIVDNNNSAVLWGSYNYPGVISGSPDTFKFYATETGSTSGTISSITITVTLSYPYNTCPGVTWPNIAVVYR